MAELNTQYADIPRSALAGAQAGTLMQRNALLQDDQAMKRQEYGNKRRDEAQMEAALMFGSLSKMPPEQQATEYPALAQHLQTKYSDVPEFSQLPPTMTPEVKSKLSMWSGAMERTAALKRQPIAPKLENIQVGDQNVPVLLTGEGMSQIGPGGPKWPPQDRAAQSASAKKDRVTELVAKRERGEPLTLDETSEITAYKEIAGASGVARVEAMKSGLPNFEDLAPEDQEYLFQQTLSGKTHDFGPGWMGTPNRTKYTFAYNKYLREHGLDPGDVVTRKAEFDALSRSLKTQQNSRGMMGGFVRNLEKQVDRVGDYQKEFINRIGVRALDTPIRALEKDIIGSGSEQVLNAYLVEISNEIAKLSTGSQASVAELSVEAQKRWNAIHDPKLSLRELQKVLDETKSMAQMRMKSVDEELDRTKAEIKKTVRTDGVAAQKTKYTPEQQERAKAKLRTMGYQIP